MMDMVLRASGSSGVTAVGLVFVLASGVQVGHLLGTAEDPIDDSQVWALMVTLKGGGHMVGLQGWRRARGRVGLGRAGWSA